MAVSRGIVLWPDEATNSRVRMIWDSLAERGVASLATHTHRLHQPHLSLLVAEDLPVDATLNAIGATPSTPLGLMAGSVGIFPPMRTLFLACIVDGDLLAEQRRVHELAAPLARDPWPYFHPGRWVPHITLSMSLTPAEIATALPLILDHLPLEGTLVRGGVEDGSTGERWPTSEKTIIE